MKFTRNPASDSRRAADQNQPVTTATTASRKTGTWLLSIQPWLLGLVLVGAVIFAYQPAWHAGFIWDDDLYVTQNKLLTAPDGLRQIWFSLDSPSQYFPLVYTSFRVERNLWGLNPAGYHWVNILLHAANALLLWRLLKRLQAPGPWLAAAIFALHPVQVESVAWITERKNVLCLFFFLLAVRAWFESVGDTDQSPMRWKFYGLSLVCYALALFSKTTACTLPAALLLILWWKHRPINWVRLLQIAPFIAVGLAMGLVTVWWEHHHQGVKSNSFGLGLPERVILASRALWFYAGKLIWPVNLTFSYPRWTITATNPWSYVWLLGETGLALTIYLIRRQTGRGVATAFLFYVAMLSPLLGFFMLATFRYSFVADHYQYIASIGPLALVAAGMARWLASYEKGRPLVKALVCAPLLLILAVLTWRQATMYADMETLWRVTIDRNPMSFMAHNNLANLLLERGEANEAMAHYRRALEIEPTADAAAFNLANALFDRGEVDEAIHYYRQAFQVQPKGAAIAFRLGNALVARGQWDEAIGFYEKALELQPDGAAVASSLGNALLARGRVDEAIDCFQKALARAPQMVGAHSGLGTAYIRKGRLADAITEYETAISLQPGNVALLANLSWVLATCPDPSIRNGSRAVELALRAEQISAVKYPEILRTLSAAYAETGRFPEAIAAIQQALDLSAVKADTSYVGLLREQLRSYEAHLPFRDTSLTNSAH